MLLLGTDMGKILAISTFLLAEWLCWVSACSIFSYTYNYVEFEARLVYSATLPCHWAQSCKAQWSSAIGRCRRKYVGLGEVTFIVQFGLPIQSLWLLHSLWLHVLADLLWNVRTTSGQSCKVKEMTMNMVINDYCYHATSKQWRT